MALPKYFIAAVAGACIFTVSGPVHAASALEEYEAASPAKKLVICAPFLYKQGGIYQLSASRLADEGKMAQAKNTAKVAFELSYRGSALQEWAQSRNPDQLHWAWELSAEKSNRSAYRTLVEFCIKHFDQQLAAGNIPAELVARARVEVARPNETASTSDRISPACRSKGTPPTDLCAAARNYAAQLAKDLPMPVNRNLTYVSAVPAGPRILLTGMLQSEKRSFDSLLLENNLTFPEFEAGYSKMLNKTLCEDQHLQAFIKQGGSLEVKFRFFDGEGLPGFVFQRCE